MVWFACRTAPGAQMPQREYTVHATSRGADGRPRGKGYTIVPSLDPNVSAVERSLSNAGFAHYMPIEKRLVRDRKKTNLWKPRRFALLLGYVFVKDVDDFRKLEETAGIASVVRSQGKPMPIMGKDILMLQSMEAVAEEKYQQLVEQRAAAERRVTRRKAAGAFPAGSSVSITSGHAKGLRGLAGAPARDGRLKVFIASLEAEISVPMDAVVLEAAE
jgi:transcription antitermination factor NusG